MKFYRTNAEVEAVQYVGQAFPDAQVNTSDRQMMYPMGGGRHTLLRPGEVAVPFGSGIVRKWVTLAPGDWLVTAPDMEPFRVAGDVFSTRYAPVPEINGDTSDGYHTFNELYAHRHALFALVLASLGPQYTFKTRKTSDGREMAGWFIAGANLPGGQISYHMPEEWWDRLSFVANIERNDQFDGHTAADVVQRLQAFIADPAQWP